MSSTVMGQMGAFHLHHIFHTKSALSGEKQCTLFECQMNVFSRKVVGDNIFMSPCGDGTAILKRGPPCVGLAVCSARAIPSFLSLFKTLSIGPVRRGIEPATFRSAVKRSTD